MIKRDLPTVINAVKLFIPSSHSGLVAGLDRVLQSALFAAPEMMVEFWAEGGRYLDDLGEVTPESEPWKRAIKAIWSNQPFV